MTPSRSRPPARPLTMAAIITTKSGLTRAANPKTTTATPRSGSIVPPLNASVSLETEVGSPAARQADFSRDLAVLGAPFGAIRIPEASSSRAVFRHNHLKSLIFITFVAADDEQIPPPAGEISRIPCEPDSNE